MIFPNYLTYTCVNYAYSDLIHRFVETLNFIAPARRIRVKANSKPYFDDQIMLAIKRRNSNILYRKFKHFRLETDKVNFEAAKMHRK